MKPRKLSSTATDLARCQHGVVARRQLLAAGISENTIDWRVGSGYLTRLFRGTYAVGRAEVSQHGLWMAGVLSSGENALLAYRSAAAAWGFARSRPAVETVRPSQALRQRASIVLAGTSLSSRLNARQTRHIPTADIASVEGVPVTSVARTLLDLASCLSGAEYKRAFLEADRLNLLDDNSLADCAARDIRRRGVGRFRDHVLERVDHVNRTRSVLEALFLDLCERSGIEPPEVNVVVCGFEVDCVWRQSRLIVELDGYSFHKGRESFERDAARSNALRADGWCLLRFTWRMLAREPNRVSAQVRAAMAAS